MSTASPSLRTLADLMNHLGGVPLDRVRFHPAPGTATLQDVTEIQEREGRTCELIEGVLVEKAVGFNEANLAAVILEILNSFVRRANLGMVTGADGTMEILPKLVRIPDVAFTSWDRLHGKRPRVPVPAVAPDLAVEVLSRSNTHGEMAVKRVHYFSAGVRQVWEFDPEGRTVTVYTSPSDSRTLSEKDTLPAGDIIPGFTLNLSEVFGELDREG